MVMKCKFPDYFPHTQKRRIAYGELTIALDTCVLNNLYRYASPTREKLLGILDKFKDNIWLANKVTEEYLQTRLTVINEEGKEYEKYLGAIKAFKAKINKLNKEEKHPHSNNRIINNLNTQLDNLSKDLRDNRDHLSKAKGSDEILKELNTLFKNKIGDPYDLDTYQEIIKEGEIRYQLGIPPGFRDEGKQTNKYGDLIIWKQLMEYSKTKMTDLVFITDDRKDDWFTNNHDSNHLPRPELICEFRDYTGKNINIITTKHFMSTALDHLGEPKISSHIISDIEETNSKNMSAKSKPYDYNEIVEEVKALLPIKDINAIEILQQFVIELENQIEFQIKGGFVHSSHAIRAETYLIDLIKSAINKYKSPRRTQ